MEHDLRSGCGGGDPGIHHRSAGDQTLLVGRASALKAQGPEFNFQWSNLACIMGL